MSCRGQAPETAKCSLKIKQPSEQNPVLEKATEQ